MPAKGAGLTSVELVSPNRYHGAGSGTAGSLSSAVGVPVGPGVPVRRASVPGSDSSGPLLLVASGDEVGSGVSDGVVDVPGVGTSGAGSGVRCSPPTSWDTVDVFPPLSVCPAAFSTPVMTIIANVNAATDPAAITDQRTVWRGRAVAGPGTASGWTSSGAAVGDCGTSGWSTSGWARWRGNGIVRAASSRTRSRLRSRERW